MSFLYKHKAYRISRKHMCSVVTSSEPQVHWNSEERLFSPALACSKLDDLSFPPCLTGIIIGQVVKEQCS